MKEQRRNRIQALRTERELTQSELAAMCGVSRATIASFESQINDLDKAAVYIVKGLAKHLKVKEKELWEKK
ncbi:MAG: XRE family transcriptional regulator [Methanomicrobia archaeon]|nr:XRE family transcriptional regulator [Methanomicrobia archaeon]